MKKLLLVYNPHAGHGMFPAQLHDVINLFTENDYLVTAYPTQKAGDATSFVRDHIHEFDVLAVSGGDGTLHECVNALMSLPKAQRIPVGFIPAGSTNDFAVSHNIDANIMKSAEEIVHGTPVFFDIGQLGSNFFTYVAAFGIFTDVPYDTPQDLKNTFGYIAYVFEGASRLPSYKAQHIVVKADGEVIEGDFVLGIVSNTTRVGGIKLQQKDIDLHDGLSELYLIKDSSNPIDFLELMNSMIRKDYSSPLLIHRQAKDITFESDAPIAWTMDGEYGGSFESVRTHTCANALPVMIKE